MTQDKLHVDSLVIGGGIAGMQSALDLADQGYRVALVEKNPSIGGKMIGLSKVFPTLDCCSCITTPKMAAVAHHENIELLTYSDIQSISRNERGFVAQVQKKPRYVIEERVHRLPVVRAGLSSSTCPMMPTNSAGPPAASSTFPSQRRCRRKPSSTSTIASSAANVFKPVRPRRLTLNSSQSNLEIEARTIILATGYEVTPYDAKEQYGAGKLRNVIDGLMMERLLAPTGPYGRVLRPSDGKQPGSIAYVQCAGSRDQTLGVPYCSRVCCMYAVKQAMLLSGTLPMADITIYYMDIRTFGKGYEQFYQSAKAMGIEFVKGKVARVTEDTGRNLDRARGIGRRKFGGRTET